MILKDRSDETPPEQIHADIVFDCTGTKRIAIKKFNQRPEDGIRFDIKTTRDLPHKAYAMIRATISSREADSVRTMTMTNIPDPVIYALAMEELRKLGWESYSIPFAYVNTFSNIKSGFPKSHMYFQVPEEKDGTRKPAMKNEDLIKFAKTLLKLARDNPDDDSEPKLIPLDESKKHPEKKIISQFFLEAQHASPGYYPGDTDYPLIFHAGDASANVPFKLSSGLENGINRLTKIIETFRINAGEIKEMDLGSFNLSFDEGMKLHMDDLDGYLKYYKGRNDFYGYEDLKKVIQIYTLAHLNCNNPHNKAIIKQGLNNVKAEYAWEMYLKGKELLGSISDDKSRLNILNPSFENILNQSMEYFELAFKRRNSLSASQKEEIETGLQNIAERFKDLGNHFLNLTPPRYKAAYQYYDLSLRIYMDTFTQSQNEQKLDLFSNLIMITLKNKKFNKISSMIEILESNIFPFIMDTKKNVRIADKIYFNAAFSALEEAHNMLGNKNYDADEFGRLTNKAKEWTSKLSDNHSEFSKLLVNKHNDLIENAGPEAGQRKKI